MWCRQSRSLYLAGMEPVFQSVPLNEGAVCPAEAVKIKAARTPEGPDDGDQRGVVIYLLISPRFVRIENIFY